MPPTPHWDSLWLCLDLLSPSPPQWVTRLVYNISYAYFKSLFKWITTSPVYLLSKRGNSEQHSEYTIKTLARVLSLMSMNPPTPLYFFLQRSCSQPSEWSFIREGRISKLLIKYEISSWTFPPIVLARYLVSFIQYWERILLTSGAGAAASWARMMIMNTRGRTLGSQRTGLKLNVRAFPRALLQESGQGMLLITSSKVEQLFPSDLS